MTEKEHHEQILREVDSEKVLASIVLKSIHESRMKRWMWFIVTILIISYLVVGWFKIPTPQIEPMSNKVPLISMYGTVGPSGGVDGHSFIHTLEEAFEGGGEDVVVIRANSPGGSPAHAKMIYDRINYLKKKYQKKLVVSVEDQCASACYYIASAADEIYVTPVSMVGSIGVKMDSWDFSEILDKLGVKNDSLHSGKNKLLISPYEKKDPEIVKYLEDQVLWQIHQVFISDVQKGRPALSDVNKNDLRFSGLVYVGANAIKEGLADKQGDIYSIIEGTGYQYKTYQPSINSLEQFIKKILPF